MNATNNAISNSASSERSTASPFLNEYKLKFVIRRLLQTFLSGLLLKFDDDVEAPWFIYLFQIVFFVLPFFYGGIFILAADLSSFSRLYLSIIGGVMYFLFVFTFKLSLLILSNRLHYRDEKKRFNEKTQKTNKISSKQTRKNTKTSLFNDEQGYEFGSCFSMATLFFLFPPLINYFLQIDSQGITKINKSILFRNVLRIFVDSILAGFIMLWGVNFESIVYLQSYYSIGGSICVFILTWCILCMSLYSLCIRDPSEPAVYQPYDQFGVQHYHRSFYVICFQLIEIIFNFSYSNAQIPWLAIFWLKIIMIGLPFMWFLGLLPPVDAFFLWLFEQAYIHLYGGSATAANLRLTFQLAFSIILSMAHFIPSDMAIIILFALFGYIFSSIDLLYMCELLYSFEVKRKSSKSGSIAPINSSSSNQVSIQNSSKKKISNPSLFNWYTVLYHLIMISLVIIISAVIFGVFTSVNLNKTTAFNIEQIMLYVGMGIFIICKLVADLQSVYIFFGLIRNPFYPKNCLSDSAVKSKQLSINQNKKFFKFLKYFRLGLLRFVVPFLLCSVISIDCYINKIYGDTTQSYWRTLVVLRAYRWIWQSSFLCLFEMCMMSHLALFVFGYNLTSDLSVQENLIKYFLTGCLVSSFARDRLVQFFQKCFTFILINITSWSVKKQRRKSSLVFLVLNFLGFVPFLLGVILIASALSAPLLPLFTFPIYLIGFPRSKSFWPQKSNFFSLSISNLEYKGGLSQNKSQQKQDKNTSFSSDSSFYAQLVPNLLESLRELILSGSIGSSFQSDTYYLTRFQDRIIWIQIMEASNSYCILNIKGLELQETSCHTTEAQYIDDSFDLAFENPFGANSNESAKKNKLLKLNPHPFDCMQARDVLLFETYSDAKNSLVGVLDSKESLSTMADFYPKILHYFIIKSMIEKDEKNLSVKESSKTETLSNSISMFNQAKSSELPPIISSPNRSISSPLQATQETLVDKIPNGKSLEYNDVEMNSILSIDRKNKAKSALSKKNITLMENKAFKIDDEEEEKVGSDFDEWSDNASIYSSKEKKPSKPIITTSNMRKLSQDEGFKDPFEFDLNEILGGMGDADAKSKNKNKHKSNDLPIENSSKSIANKIKRGIDVGNTNKSSDYTDLVSMSRLEKNNSPLSLPFEWASFLNENLNFSSSYDNKNLKTSIMSKKWLEKILDLINQLQNKTNTTEKENVLNDYEINLWAGHYKFLLKCCHTLGFSENLTSNFNPQSMHKFFKGDLPWTPLNEKLTQELPDLYNILVKSFRYTVKMVIDHVTICPISDDDEFFDNLKTYEQEWFIGTETDPKFAQNILESKPFLFSLYKDPLKKSLNSRTLSIQQIRSPLARLNNEIVKSIWSSTNLELLYMTNDDDERYSIQAHPYILRNLTIQTSALGYCIYNSENIYLSLI